MWRRREHRIVYFLDLAVARSVTISNFGGKFGPTVDNMAKIYCVGQMLKVSSRWHGNHVVLDDDKHDGNCVNLFSGFIIHMSIMWYIIIN